MNKILPVMIFIQKGDKFILIQCPKNNVKRKEIESISYAYIVKSLMYLQTCIKLDINFIVVMLGKYQSNLEIDHQKTTNKILRYFQRTKNYIVTYKKSNELEVIGY